MLVYFTRGAHVDILSEVKCMGEQLDVFSNQTTVALHYPGSVRNTALSQSRMIAPWLQAYSMGVFSKLTNHVPCL